MLKPLPIPALFITGTDTGIGKTVIAGAIANWFKRRGARVAVCKPVATGCIHGREGLISEDAEFLAHSADARHPLDLICPQRYAEPLAPAVAAERSRQPLDWEAIARSLRIMSEGSDVMIVEGVGGLLVPMDKKYTVLDVITWLAAQAVVVTRPGLGTINHTLLTTHALDIAKAPVAGIVVNRYPAESPSVAEESNPRIIEKWSRKPVLCIVPEEKIAQAGKLPPGIVAAIDTVDWAGLAEKRD